MIAYCFRNGLIYSTQDSAPEGSIELLRGPTASVARVIKDTAEERDGEFFVPGLMEGNSIGDDQQHLLIYLESVRDAADRLVTVNDLTRESLERDTVEAS